MKKCGRSNNILCIDTVNPYIKSLGFTDIMSDSKEETPTVSPDLGATGETATSDRDGKGKCARCSRDLFECKLKEVKELPCRHYCHLLCVVLFYEIEWEEAYCSYGCRIPSDWLKKTVDEIKEQQRINEVKRLVLLSFIS